MEKGNKINYKKRRKRLILKGIFISGFLLVILVYFITTSSIFDIKSINIVGENIALKNTLEENTKYLIGKNIFKVTEEEVEGKLKENPYIKNASLKRGYPNKLNINIEENDVAYYIGKGKNAYILSSSLRILEKNINGHLNSDIKNLIEVSGLKMEGLEIGESLGSKDDTRVKSVCENLYKVKKANKTSHQITRVDFGSLTNIKMYTGNVEIRVGDGKDVIKKINTALNILEDKDINLKNGYIDISFEGDPVIKRE